MKHSVVASCAYCLGHSATINVRSLDKHGSSLALKNATLNFNKHYKRRKRSAKSYFAVFPRLPASLSHSQTAVVHNHTHSHRKMHQIVPL